MNRDEFFKACKKCKFLQITLDNKKINFFIDHIWEDMIHMYCIDSHDPYCFYLHELWEFYQTGKLLVYPNFRLVLQNGKPINSYF